MRNQEISQAIPINKRRPKDMGINCPAVCTFMTRMELKAMKGTAILTANCCIICLCSGFIKFPFLQRSPRMMGRNIAVNAGSSAVINNHSMVYLL